MRISARVLIALLTAAAASGIHADAGYRVTNSTSISTEQRPPRDSYNNDSHHNNAQTLDCAKNKSDPRCGQPPRPYYPPQHPHYPQPHRPRPVIINQLPPEPAIEIDSLTDDWDGCRKAKLGTIKARDSGRADEANKLDEWLWKNCRAYSYELRQLEQDDM